MSKVRVIIAILALQIVLIQPVMAGSPLTITTLSLNTIGNLVASVDGESVSLRGPAFSEEVKAMEKGFCNKTEKNFIQKADPLHVLKAFEMNQRSLFFKIRF